MTLITRECDKINNDMEFLSKNTTETAEIAEDFVSKLKLNNKTATIIGLYGELGSGKTTFMKYVAEILGIKETIQSPTFVIMKRFHTDVRDPLPLGEGVGGGVFNLVHIDAYRIEKEEEMINLGWQNLISDPSNLIFIEWPEKITSIMPPHIMIKFEHGQSENERKISIA